MCGVFIQIKISLKEANPCVIERKGIHNSTKQATILFSPLQFFSSLFYKLP